MVAIKIASFEDVRKARACARQLAQVAGVRDPGAVETTAGELGNNCVEHGGERPGLLWIGCQRGQLSMRFENLCEEQPSWQTHKPALVDEFRTGGYGLQIARALARSVHCRWSQGRVEIRAEFE
jgi:hypothetical protein